MRTSVSGARWVAVALVLVLLGCGDGRPVGAASSRRAIVGGGATAGAGFEDVFLLAFTFDNGVSTICTGTLISARSLITAAHCVAPSRQGAASVTIKATHKATDQGLTGADLIDVTEYRLHPSWSPSSTSADDDLALLLLAQAPPGVTPRPLNRAALGGFTGQPITLVGYGRTGASLTDSGVRRAANATVTSVASLTFGFGAAGTLGICAGDSGGPSLHTFGDGVERIVGVHSLTSSSSCGVGSDARIDAHLGFIDTWLAQKEPAVDAGTGADAGSSVASLGDVCVQGLTQCTLATVCAAPAGLPTICRRACEADGGCPAQAHCEAGEGGARYCRADGTAPPGTTPPETVQGCGCAGAGGEAWWAAALVLGALARRRALPALEPQRHLVADEALDFLG